MLNINGRVRTGPKFTQPNRQNKQEKEGRRGHTIYCSYCDKADDQYTTMCPQKLADSRNESEQCLAKNRSHGVMCRLRGAPGRANYHHKLATGDYAKKIRAYPKQDQLQREAQWP
eukprot:977044-Karenia_brevis.AAC.1